MAKGDIVISDGIEFVITWDGVDDLLPERPSRPSVVWEPPKRLYNKTSDYWEQHGGKSITIDKDDQIEDDLDNLDNRDKEDDNGE